MARQRVLSIIEREGADGKTLYYARTSFKGKDGKRHTLWRSGTTKTDARENLEKALDEMKEWGERAVLKPRQTFTELAKYFEDRYVVPAKYIDGRKVSGMRSHANRKFLLANLREYFGPMRLKEIKHGDLEDYKGHRLGTPVVFKSKDKETGEMIKTGERQRAIASVNRELSLMRRILNIGVRQGWVSRNPFNEGDSLISVADETKRERILSMEEEGKLLLACTGKREHLRRILICALDTGMRQGEIFSLTWKNVNFRRRLMVIEAANTKTMKSREVPMSTRLYTELAALYEVTDKHPDTSVFGIESNVKRSFAAACDEAGIEGFRFHDTRHSAASRFIRGGMELQEVGRILGHTQAQTTYRYVNINTETIYRAAEVIDKMHAAHEKKEPIN